MRYSQHGLCCLEIQRDGEGVKMINGQCPDLFVLPHQYNGGPTVKLACRKFEHDLN